MYNRQIVKCVTMKQKYLPGVSLRAEQVSYDETIKTFMRLGEYICVDILYDEKLTGQESWACKRYSLTFFKDYQWWEQEYSCILTCKRAKLINLSRRISFVDKERK